MTNGIIHGKWNRFCGYVRKWLDNRSGVRLTTVDHQREQSIGILQKRYGYTKEKVSFELSKHYSKARLS
jgi:uncharacterized protein YjbJ (UPF0337 family)